MLAVIIKAALLTINHVISLRIARSLVFVRTKLIAACTRLPFFPETLVVKFRRNEAVCGIGTFGDDEANLSYLTGEAFRMDLRDAPQVQGCEVTGYWCTDTGNEWVECRRILVRRKIDRD